MKRKSPSATPKAAPGTSGRQDPHAARSHAVNSFRQMHQKDVMNRLKRIEGQIRGVIEMIEGGSSCEDIAQQMAASRKAMDRAFFRMMACSMMESVAGSDPSSFDEVERSTKILEKYA